MKLCHIVPSLEERHGGPSKSALALSVALADSGNEVELLTTKKTPEPTRTVGSLGVFTFQRGSPGAFCPSRGLREHLAQSRVHAVHHHSLWLRTLHYAHQSAQKQQVPLVISPRGMMGHWAWKHHYWRKLLARTLVHPGALVKADGWHATSQQEADSIRALGFKQPICVAANGIAIPEAAKMEQAAAYWHGICPESAKRPVALFYSRFHRKKRVLELIDLWAQLALPNWLLLIVGIPQEYTVTSLEDYALRASAGNVRVFSGLGLPAPYSAASLFILPSHNENFGLAVAEALAHGVPALVTDTTPWAALNSLGGGWCVSWQDFGKTLKKATTETLPVLASRGARGKEWVLREFSWEQPAKSLADFYLQLAAK